MFCLNGVALDKSRGHNICTQLLKQFPIFRYLALCDVILLCDLAYNQVCTVCIHTSQMHMSECEMVRFHAATH